MKHAYIIILNFEYTDMYMPYIFTSLKEAILFGEYAFRTSTCKSYEIEKFYKITPFYKLK